MTAKHTITSFTTNAVKPFKLYVGLHLFVVLYNAIETSLSPYVTKIFINTLTETPRDELFTKVWPVTSILILLTILNGVLWRISDYAWIKFSPRLKKKITVESMDYLMQHSFTFFQNNFAGSLANKVRDLANCTHQIFERLLFNFLHVTLILVIAFFTLLSINKFFAFGLIAWAIIFILIAIRGGKKASALGIPQADQHTKITGVLVDILSNISNVKLFSRTRFERRKIESLQDEFTKVSEAKNWFLLKFFSVSDASFCAYQIVCILALVHFYQQGSVTLGDFFMLFGINNWVIHMMWASAQELRGFLEDIGTMNQALNVMNEPLKIKDTEDASKLVMQEKNGGEIIFENVSFAYGENSNPIFSGKNLVIKPGQKVGLVGQSGSGKSTFVNLVLRLFDVTSGRILIDGQDISRVTQDSLRSAIGMIPQDPSLFHRTLAENISYGISIPNSAFDYPLSQVGKESNPDPSIEPSIISTNQHQTRLVFSASGAHASPIHSVSALTNQPCLTQVSEILNDSNNGSRFNLNLFPLVVEGDQGPEGWDNQIIEAAKKSHAHEFISQLPESYNSLVGERGIKLSGGQRQRIAIARAFLKNAPILILDEATSALDSITEEQIQDSLKQLVKDKTTLVIAHRLSTLRDMDRILVFDSGKIVEEGSHQQLLALNGTYKKLWDSQVGGFIVDEDTIPSSTFTPSGVISFGKIS